MRNLTLSKFAILKSVFLALIFLPLPTAEVSADATVRGQVEFDKKMSESWDKKKLVVPFGEIETRLFERVTPPSVPFPNGWDKFTPKERQEWAKQFEKTSVYKKLVEKKNKMLEEAHSFDVKIDEEGKFVVFEVPPRVYGIQGRVDKEIGDTVYRFEIFGQIEVLKDVDQISLDPIQIAITPLHKNGAAAPPLSVKSHDNKANLSLDKFKGKWLFLNFWISTSESAAYQKEIQDMFKGIKDKHNIDMLSICVDEKRQGGLDYLIKNQFRLGRHGFTDGLYHRALFDYGVRTIPSFWLISPDGKIKMTQFEFAFALRASDDFGEIISNRILGKDEPTLAKPKEGEAKTEAPKKKAG